MMTGALEEIITQDELLRWLGNQERTARVQSGGPPRLRLIAVVARISGTDVVAATAPELTQATGPGEQPPRIDVRRKNGQALARVKDLV